MAKKKTQPRRVQRAAEPRMYGDGKPSQLAQPTNGAATAPTSAAAPASSTGAPRPLTTRGVRPARPANQATRGAAVPARVPVTTTTDYSYVVKDLRRLGMIAAALFTMLIALGLIIR